MMDLSKNPPVLGHAVLNYSMVGMNEGDWRVKRLESLGCSEASAVAGLNKYRTPLDVYMQKCSLIRGFEGSRAARLGTALEPFIAAEFERETGFVTHDVTWNLAHPDEPRFTATLDRVCMANGRPAVVELKNPGWRQKREWAEAVVTGSPAPGSTIESYFYQTIGQMSVTGFGLGFLVGLVDKDLYVIRIERTKALEELCEWIPIQVGAFWRNHIEKQVPPPADGRDVKSLDTLYKSATDGTSVADPELRPGVERIRKIKGDIKLLQAEADEIIARVKSTMGAAEVLTFGDDTKRVTWKNSKTSRFDSKSFRASSPDVYTDFVVETATRRFTY
jgi:predicted phage-related endonuclease